MKYAKLLQNLKPRLQMADFLLTRRPIGSSIGQHGTQARRSTSLKQRTNAMRWPFLIPVLLVSFIQPAAGAGDDAHLQAIRALLSERLVIMEQVAAHKWNEDLPISDKDREGIVLETAIARATAEGLEPQRATRLMTAQIEAAKSVQRELFVRWRAEGRGKHAAVPNLVTSLRPKISRLSSELIAALVAARNELDGCLAQQVLTPPPAELAQFSKAWTLAVDGALAALRPCKGQ